MQAVTGRTRSAVLLDPELSADEEELLRRLVARRLSGEPLQYLEGSVSFGGLDIAVDRRALIPRPETEELLELATRSVAHPAVIVELCTGSGNLALALKHRFPDAAVYATDIDDRALALAAENMRRLGLDVHLGRGSLFAPLPDEIRGAVDLIVANPPYVAEGDVLPAVVSDHEPAIALFAGSDGLDVMRGIGAEAAAWLAPAGLIAVESASDQAAAAAAVFVGLATTVVVDLTGRDRFVIGRHPQPAD
jgi:release factor glutamine methyltransferase